MSVIGRLCALTALLTILAGCHAPAPAPVEPLALPHWEALGAANIDRSSFEPNSIATDGEDFVLAGNDFAINGAHSLLYRSADGHTWTQTDAGQQGWAEVAGDGDDLYALWADARVGRLVIRHYAGDGGWDDPVGLVPTIPRDDISFAISSSWAIAAGPEGVQVAYKAYDRTQVWSSRDGWTFTSTVLTLTARSMAANATPVTRAAAVNTPIGVALVLVSLVDELRLSMADAWTAKVIEGAPEFSFVDFVATNGDRLSLHGTTLGRLKEGDQGFVPGDDPMRNNEFNTPLTQCSTRSSPQLRAASVDAGRLPDRGVSTAYFPEAVTALQSGFLMVGYTLSHFDVGQGTAGVWISDDGCSWRKDLVHDNRFDEANKIVGAATRDGITVLVGIKVTGVVGTPVLWVG